MVHLDIMKNQLVIWTWLQDGRHLGSSGQHGFFMPDLSTISGSEPAKRPPNGHSQGVCTPNSHRVRLSVIDPEEMSYLCGLRCSGPRVIDSYFLLRAPGQIESWEDRNNCKIQEKLTQKFALPLRIQTHLNGFLTVVLSIRPISGIPSSSISPSLTQWT
jgi:hypothetical protein